MRGRTLLRGYLFPLAVGIALFCLVRFTLRTERGSYWARLLKISRGQDDFSSIFGLPMESIKLTEAIRRQLKLPATLLQPYNLRRPHLKSFSQHAQDRLAAEIFKNQKGLYFVEVGALDGETMSNTLYLERELGWKGLLIEPTPAIFDRMIAKNRKTVGLNACLSPNKTAMELPFRQVTLDAKYNGLVMEGENVTRSNVSSTTILVPCYPFYNILEAVGNPIVDFLSLDIEGAELEVLKTIPWDKVKIRLICVEVIHTQGGEDAVKSFLKEKGYTFLLTKKFDSYFYKTDLASGMSV
uniref:Protein Star-like n=1 Tax=Hirondellea gigas TaxID=1518452 RepID=A0A2P2IA64_9CRUS